MLRRIHGARRRIAMDLSLAPRQALGPSSTNGLRSSNGRFAENRPFAHSGRFCRHKSTKETVKTIARGKPGDFRRTRGDYRVLLPMHTGCGCSGHPAFPAPSLLEGQCSCKPPAYRAARSRRCVCNFAAARPSRRGQVAAPQDERVTFGAKSNPHGEEAHRAVSNHEAP